jgi:polysaccharide chain length determinant protein (PEP-CTERM system associated)
MDEIVRQTIITLRGMWRHRWLGLSVAWGVGAIGAIGLMFFQEKYEASARIFVNTASILKPLMVGMTVQPNDDQRVFNVSRVIISRPNVEKLVQAIGLDTSIGNKEAFEKQVDRVTKSLDLKGTGRDNLYTLTFRDPDPEIAKKGVAQLTSMFIATGEGGKAGDTEAAKKFVDEQIALYEKKLQEAENRLKEFKLRYLGMSPGEGAGYFARLSETNALLTRAQLELREAENSRDALLRGLRASEDASSSLYSGPSAASVQLTEVDSRIESQRRNLDTLLQRYTENHPDVIGARRVIGELEEQRQRLLVERRKEPASTGLPVVSSGPRASEQLRVQLATAEASVASLRTRVAEYSQRYNQLKASATLMPQLEAEYAQLNRDYDINKKNYESLVSRRESVNISEDMQGVSGVADFRMIDPPRVSPKPVMPNRRLLLPLVLLLSLAAGIGAAFIAHESRPTFSDRRSLAEATGLPILGAVSLVVSPSAKLATKASLTRFVGGVSLLVGLFIAGFAALLLTSKTIA